MIDAEKQRREIITFSKGRFICNTVGEGTEIELIADGKNSDIVLGYRSPFVRQFTGFAVETENQSEIKPLEEVKS